MGFDKTCPTTKDGHYCEVPCLKTFVGHPVKIKCTSAKWVIKKPICVRNKKYYLFLCYANYQNQFQIFFYKQKFQLDDVSEKTRFFFP